MKGDTANQLNIKWTKTEHAIASLADESESIWQDSIKVLLIVGNLWSFFSFLVGFFALVFSLVFFGFNFLDGSLGGALLLELSEALS